jgi:hypothetical protein
MHGRTPLQRELTARYSASAAEETRKKWGYLRRVLPKYRLGRSEFHPIRSLAEAIAKYVGHYLDSGQKLRKDDWIGCRRVEWSRRTKTRRLQVNDFAFANFCDLRVYNKETKTSKKTGEKGTGGVGRIWRLHCAALLAAVGGNIEEDMDVILDKKWRYRYRPQLMADEATFQEWLRDEVPRILRFRRLATAWKPSPRKWHERIKRPGAGVA